MPSQVTVGTWVDRSGKKHVSLTKKFVNKDDEVYKTTHFAIAADDADRVGSEIQAQGRLIQVEEVAHTVTLSVNPKT